MIKRMILTTLVFAVVIGAGAGAYALMSDGTQQGFGGKFSASSFYDGDDDDHDDDDHDRDDD